MACAGGGRDASKLGQIETNLGILRLRSVFGVMKTDLKNVSVLSHFGSNLTRLMDNTDTTVVVLVVYCFTGGCKL